jgi:hypothetical protein
MIVQKSQFDVDKIKVGSAYFMTKKVRAFYELNKPCIVIGVSPLMIHVSYYCDSINRMQEISISINEVTDGVFTLEKMKLESVN